MIVVYLLDSCKVLLLTIIVVYFIHCPGNEDNWWYFIHPFTWHVWLLVLAAMFLGPFVLVAVSFAVRTSHFTSGDRDIGNIVQAFWFYLGALLQQGRKDIKF